MANGTLIKVDRNGSKYYEGWVICDRCSGRGLFATGTVNGQLRITPVDSGICHKCFGEGKVWSKWIERTSEYEAKLADRRAKKAAKKAAETEARRAAEFESNCKETLLKNGFTPEGITFIVLGDTYTKREEIKEAGGVFDYILGWHINHETEEFDSFPVKYEDVAEFTPWGKLYYKVSAYEVEDMKRAEMKRRIVKESDYIGNIGDKIDMKVTYERSASFEVKSFTGFGTETMFIHTFRDEDGNLLIWKTGKGLHISRDEKVMLKGTVKEHTEYKGDKQTVLTRCKVVKA